jgi:hypothetical protein
MSAARYPFSVYRERVVSRARSRILAAAAASAALLASPAASASPEADARELFARGRELRHAGDCASAAPLFRRASEIYPEALGSLRNLAECEEALGHVIAARGAWLHLAKAVVAAPSEKYAGWDKDGEEAATRLSARVAVFSLDVLDKMAAGEQPVTGGVEVLVDGEPLDPGLIGVPIERDPGTHHVRVQIPDAPPVEEQVTLAVGANPPLVVRFDRAPARPPPQESSVPSGALTERRIVGWTAIGVGVGALLASVFTFRSRNAALAAVDARCPSHRSCPDDLRVEVSRGETMAALTSILVPVGIVAVGTGFAVVLASRPRPGGNARSYWMTPSAGGLRVGGTF